MIVGAACRYLILGTAVLAVASLPAAAEKPATAPDTALMAGHTIPLGPPAPSIRTSLPKERNAFPVDIMTRMRAALVAQAATKGSPLPATGRE